MTTNKNKLKGRLRTAGMTGQGEQDGAKTLIAIVLSLACFLTVLSQHPTLVEVGATRLLALPSWLLVVFVLVLTGVHSISKNVAPVAFFALCFFLLVSILTLFLAKPYFESGLTYSFALSIFIFLVGALGAGNVTRKTLYYCSLSYVVAATLLAVAVYFLYFYGNDSAFSNGVYAYASKNSLAQIILTAILLLLVIFRPKSAMLNLGRYGMVTFLIVFLFMLRSRATMISFAVALLVILLFGKRIGEVRRERKAILFAVLIFLLLLVFNGEFRSFFINDIVLAGRSSASVDDVSSGRLSLLEEVLPLVKENIFFGVGNYYYDCFPLAAVLQFGILGAWPLFGAAIYPVYRATRPNAFGRVWQFTLLLIALSYFVNGFFECLPPFGPGVKCFFLWLLLGLSVGRPLDAFDGDDIS